MCTRTNVVIALLVCLSACRQPASVDDGQEGAQGEKGDPGEAGKDGVDGEDGAMGAIGPAGADGVDGADGKPASKADLYEVSESKTLFGHFSGDVSASCSALGDIALNGRCESADASAYLLGAGAVNVTSTSLPSSWQCSFYNGRSADAVIIATVTCIRE